MMDHESAKKLLCRKKFFDSYEEFKAHFDDWERKTNSVFTIVSSKPFSSEKPETDALTTDVICNPNLKYSYLRLQCKFGGPRRFRGNGIRKTLTHKMDCPAYVNIKWSQDRQQLMFGNMELRHCNHPQSEEAYTFLRERKNLSRTTRKEADKLLKQKNDINTIGQEKKRNAVIRMGLLNSDGNLEAIERLFSDDTSEECVALRNTVFSTEEELLQWIKTYEELSGQKFKTLWSTRITEYWVGKGFTNTAMGYKQAMFICEKADSSELRKKEEGEPQCPASIYISYTPDKQSLRVKKINDNHVHKANPNTSTTRNTVKDDKWQKKLQETKSKYVEIIKLKDEQLFSKDLEYKSSINDLKATVANLESLLQDCKSKVLNLEAQIYANNPEYIVENEEVMWTEAFNMDNESVEEIVEIPEISTEPKIENQRGPISFYDRDSAVQRFFLLKWLLPAEKLILVLNRDEKINDFDIIYFLTNPEAINDSFLEAKQELQLIYNDFDIGVLEKFEEALQKKIDEKIYLCGSCGAIKDLNDWILCDGCLIWCHAKCIQIFAEVGGHFCHDCVKTIF